MEVFDEDKAIRYILDALAKSNNTTKKYSDDDILEVIDLIWDYYEDNGFLDIDMDDESDGAESVDKTKLIAWITKMVKKDHNSNLNPEDLPAIIDAELAYEALCGEL